MSAKEVRDSITCRYTRTGSGSSGTAVTSRERPSFNATSLPQGAACGAVRLTAACCARPTRFRARCGRAGGPRELASLRHAHGPDPRPVLANSSGCPCVLGGGSRDAPPHPRPASFEPRRGLGVSEEGSLLFRCTSGVLSGSEGCPASGVRAPAGPRTAPRAGRRIRRAHVFDEHCEEFALAPAARAVEPMRVAGAQEPPWDIPPTRDSGGTMKWTGGPSGLSGPFSLPVEVVLPPKGNGAGQKARPASNRCCF